MVIQRMRSVRKRYSTKFIVPLIFVFVFAGVGVTQLLFTKAEVALGFGDLNNDGKVSVIDLSILLTHFGQAQPSSDLNSDGNVSVIDLSILLSNYGKNTPTSTTKGIQAQRAADFADTIGINVHINYFNKSYGNWPMVKQRLSELKIKHVRGSAYWNFTEADRRQDELASMGIKVNMLMDNKSIPEQVAYLKKKPNSFISGLESINEPDCFLSKETGDWANIARQHHKDTYNAVQAEPSLQSIPFLSIAYCRGTTDATIGDLSPWFSHLNIHPYPGGNPPEDRISSSMNSIKQLFGGNKPIVATETGYFTAIPFLKGGGISEEAQGIYTPRLFLSYYQQGITRTYLYEMLEQEPSSSITQTFNNENHFGIYRSNFAEKPAATNLRRLLTRLEDSNTSFTPEKLDYSIEGDSANLEQQLFQKSDGTFVLALWRKDSVFDVYNRRALAAPNKALTVTFKEPITSATVYNINKSDTPVSSGNSASLPLTIGPEVQLIEIKR